ncbi:MAG: hypothetical protein IMZ64_05040 [Bacteroidetes bacterium]|nr:hypothetical protein [Bacteroidota bacterium]
MADIRQKVRRITGRPSDQQITDTQIDAYVNTFYIYDLPEHLRLESLLVNYQFLTTANRAVYDFPKELYLTNSTPVYIGGYFTYMTQSRSNFFLMNQQLQYISSQVTTGTGATPGNYTFTLSNLPIVPGYKRNPPGAYTGSTTDALPKNINWNVLITAQGDPGADGIPVWYSLVDDGMGKLVSLNDTTVAGYTTFGTINYLTGAVSIPDFVNSALVAVDIPLGNTINAQYIPYMASRPRSVIFFQDQMTFWPIPDQPYSVSFEAYRYPTELAKATDDPQLREWWQLLAYGAADKIFTDNADFENASKFRPLLEEQKKLVQRRSIVQQTQDRTATIFTQQTGLGPFGYYFRGF